MSEPSHIQVRGACEHNLQQVDVDIPRNALVVFTGVSGSGKSSLVYDTIHQEGQRRFMESLSSYARQFLGQMERPQVESVHGVSPTVSIDQKTVNRNPRSTVGTITEIYDHLRLLLARLGTPHCTVCGSEVRRLAVDQVVDRVWSQLPGSKISVLGPVVQERKGEYRREFAELHRDGWVRARVDGAWVELEQAPSLARYERHTIEVVVDRLKVGRDRGRLAEAIETASVLGHGVVTLVPKEGDELVFSLERACAAHPEQSIPELEPRLFSFNAPQGACPTCSGLGALEDFEVNKIIDFTKPAVDSFRAFNASGKVPFAHFHRSTLQMIVELLHGPATAPLFAWPSQTLHELIYGKEGLSYTIEITKGSRSEIRERPWRGLLHIVQEVWKWTKFPTLEKLRSRVTCPDCSGKRLHPAALAVTFRNQNIAFLTGLSVEDAVAWFDALALTEEEAEIGRALVDEIRERLGFLQQVGLGYLGLDRTANTLSGGESQRIRLASQVGSALQGVTYILDEPSIGLHPRDNRRLLTAIERLRDRGNSVLVVEHDAETMLSADWLVDIGPGAGKHGGHLVASGPPAEVARGPGLTAAWLRGERSIPVPTRRARAERWLTLHDAHCNNVAGATVRFPLGRLIGVTGVSGSGKSSLIFGVLEPAIRAHLRGEDSPCSFDAPIDKLIRISQTPIGRTPRSNPATYTKVFDPIRALFASTTLAKERGWKKGRFSFNVTGGRCEACQGAGVTVVELQFLPSVSVPCEICGGRRFNAETLEVRWKGKTIFDVLEMPVAEAAVFFKNQPKIHRILRTMDSVGLGYVSLGQPSTTLSGGEAQRVKLATELHRPGTGSTIYLLDEPTTGLHFEDVARLILSLQALVDAGNTVIVVEHHSDIIKVTDWVIDLGPEGGVGGGQIVGEGTPEAVAALSTPTGVVLREVLEERVPMAADAPATYVPTVRPHRLIVTGARRHNLKGVDVEIPHNQLTVITGPSGSGKSSLAFDTIFSEGQRRYVESLSTYARRFLGRLDRAPVTSITGLQPAIAIDQRGSSRNPRSTVATVTELHDVLRLLYARIGQPHCHQCGERLQGRSPSAVATLLAEQSPGAGWLCAPLKGVEAPANRREALISSGWTRLLHKGTQVDLSEQKDAERLLSTGCLLVIDRFNPAAIERSRVAEAAERAYTEGANQGVFVSRLGVHTPFSALPRCTTHGVIHSTELTPRHFSFNSQIGACSQCDGLGKITQLIENRLFDLKEDSFWTAIDSKVGSVISRSHRKRALVVALFESFDLTEHSPPKVWPPELWQAIMDGLDTPLFLKWTMKWGSANRKVEEERTWPGLRSILKGSAHRLDHLMADTICPRCEGGRLEPRLLAVTVGGLGLHQLLAHTIDGAQAWANGLELQGGAAVVAERPLLELRQRLRFLVDVGLSYLTLDRSARSLSGGEAQRIRLASQLGSGLVGVTYVLDEPTVGLHPRDTEKLLDTLVGLRDLGNTVVVVEHDLDTIQRADQLIDLGPAAGAHGGELVAAGTVDQIRRDPRSLTGRWLSGAEQMPKRTRRKPRSWMTLVGPTAHNLRLKQVKIPTGVWVGVAGVSGSGKSTLIIDTLAPLLEIECGKTAFAAAHKRFKVGEKIQRSVLINQAPIGSSPRSTPATYCKILGPLRELFAQLPGSKERGWTRTRFSWNSPKGGRCTVCEGRGSLLIEMHFLPDVWVTCRSCGGRRFGRETLKVRFKGHSIADVLGMRIDEALALFQNQQKIHRQLQALVDVGLGYVALGQPATTLSGGEAQRIKLAASLTHRRGHCVYILDEPTTGLHLSDVAMLVNVLDALVDKGHTVITIEHHTDMLRSADWIIELGPEGGAGGGQLLAAGPPAAIINADTATGRALRT